MWEFTLIFLIGLGIGIFVKTILTDQSQPKSDMNEKLERPLSQATVETDISRLYNMAHGMKTYYYNTAHPKDLYDSSDFQRCVELMSSSKFSKEALYDYYLGENEIISCVAMEVLRHRKLEDTDIQEIIDTIEDCELKPLYFALRTIHDNASDKVIGEVLLQAQYWWS